MSQRRLRAPWACAFLVVLASVACGAGCDDGDGTSSGATGAGAGGAGAGGQGGSGTGGAPQSFGPPGTDIVSAGAVVSNGQYRLVFTVGQSTQNQVKMTSSSYRLQGGVIGANGSLP